MRFVERRAFARQTVSHATTLTLTNESKFAAQIVEVSARGLRIELDQQLSPGSPVRLDLDDQTVLGRVCYCALNQYAGTYLAGIYLEHTLEDLEDLAKLSHMLAGGEAYKRTA